MIPFRIPALGPWLVGAATLAVITGSGAAAWNAATWRAEAAHATAVEVLNRRMTTMADEKHRLELAVAAANKALAVAAEQSKAADAVAAEAQKRADLLAQVSQTRLDKLASALGSSSSCSDVLARYWELRK